MKDKTIRFLLVANLVVMTLVLGTQLLRPAPAEAQVRVKWEYLLLNANEVKDFNNKGKEGWELIQYLQSGNLVEAGQGVFKRRIN